MSEIAQKIWLSAEWMLRVVIILSGLGMQSAIAGSTVTQSSSITHDATTGLTTKVIVQPGAVDASQTVETDYTYDSYGNPIQTDVKGCVWTSPSVCAATTRTTKSSYDVPTYHAALPTGATNALNQSLGADYDVRFGVTTSGSDLNGLTTTQTIDTFGRVTLVTNPDGTRLATAYDYCSGVNGGTAACPTYGAYTVSTTPQDSSGTQNGPITVFYFDTLSRLIAKDTQAPDSSWIRVSLQYDVNGRLLQTSRPYFLSGGTPKWTVNSTFDALNRVTQVTYPDGSHTTYAYHGLSTSTTNDAGQTTTTVRNAQGKVASVLDAASQTTSFAYDAIGDLTSAQDPAGNTTSATYDVRGRITGASSGDRGSWSYVYDSFSELNIQTNAKGQVSSLTYDALGRLTGRTEVGMTSTWTYDSATHGIGLLASTTTGANFSQTQTYDALSRPSASTIQLDATNYTYTTAYNTDGQIDTLTYPSGFVGRYIYALGYLSQIKDNGTGASVWAAGAQDAELHLLTQTTGNGVTTTQAFDANTGRILQIRAGASDSVQNQSYNWDTVGNLTSRADTFQGYTETFGYDALNRLTSSQVGALPAHTIAYDASGNITKKSDICGTANCFTYGSSAGPHAMTGIVGTYNGVTNPVFTYDANGNLLSGGARTFTWTSFDMAATVTQGLVSMSFAYDSAHNRIKACLPNCGSPTSTTFYLNDTVTGTMSEKVVSGATTTWHDYVQAEGNIVAERFRTSSTVSWRYFVLDHLGSTTTLTDDAGTVQERLSYDPWGKRRNADGSDNATCSVTSATSRGFTGHEMIDAACMVNMNARLYDPSLGRFIAADDVQSGTNDGQDQNIYSYVGNGPLSATDSTGHIKDQPNDPPACFGSCPGTSTSYSQFGTKWSRTQTCNVTPGVGGLCLTRWDPDTGDLIRVGIRNLVFVGGEPSVKPGRSRGDGPSGSGGRKSSSSSTSNSDTNGTPHNYGYPTGTYCSAKQAFDMLRAPGMSAPGAPYAQSGSHNLNLTFGNPINQNVNTQTMTITNTTLPGHWFYPGTVTLQVTAGPNNTSTVSFYGTGTGPEPLFNDLVGIQFFGGVASQIADSCMGTSPALH